MSSSLSIPILTIPAYYLLSLFPHLYATMIASGGDLGTIDTRNPNGSANKDAIRKRLSSRAFATWERAENCHRNSLENMPLFAATVFAGVLAEQRLAVSYGTTAASFGTTTFALAFLACRVAYAASFILVETKRYSPVRSLLYMLSTGLAFVYLFRAAAVLA